MPPRADGCAAAAGMREQSANYAIQTRHKVTKNNVIQKTAKIRHNINTIAILAQKFFPVKGCGCKVSDSWFGKCRTGHRPVPTKCFVLLVRRAFHHILFDHYRFSARKYFLRLAWCCRTTHKTISLNTAYSTDWDRDRRHAPHNNSCAVHTTSPAISLTSARQWWASRAGCGFHRLW